MDLVPLLIVLALIAGGFLVLALSALFTFLIVRDTARREGRWGVNVRPGRCPRCNVKLATARRPRSLRQALWGGQTCAGCGLEVDKWSRPTPDPPSR